MSAFTDGGATVDAVRASAQRLKGTPRDYDALLDMVGDARFVLLGEASHGTDDFYRERAEITKRLIHEKGFTAVAVEADWPDAYRVNCYVRGVGDDARAVDALAGFKRFPAWMWRNTVVSEFVDWLREHNLRQPDQRRRTGFYGLDLYSLNTSIEAVIGYLNSVDPEAAARARERYACFEMFGNNPESYGLSTGAGASEPCEDEVVAQLQEMQRRATWRDHAGPIDEDDAFAAEQNARLVKNAEEYYRAMFRGRVSSWNLRDRHMVETLNALVQHLNRHGDNAKVAIWAHNSHLGDARATEMGRGGEWNVGQLARELYGREALLVGFSTHTGTVTAATDWGGPAETKRVNPSLPRSWERLFHDTGVPRLFLNLRDDKRLRVALAEERLERAIGVIYRPSTERVSHFFGANLPEQFDALLHFDETNAVQPLEVVAPMPEEELAETFPFKE